VTTFHEVQFAGTRLVNAVTVADLDALRTLSTEQRERQLAAREELVHYLTVVWEQAKQRGERSSENPLYVGIGSARDLMIAMASNARNPTSYADELRIDDPKYRAELMADIAEDRAGQ
jgi:CBS domain-containing protein